MEGRVPLEMLILFCHGKQATFSAFDFATWVWEQHWPPLQKTGLVAEVTVYEAAKSMTNDPLPKFLLLYEHGGLDIDQTYNTINDLLVAATTPVAIEQFGCLERIGRWSTAKSSYSEGLLIGITNCKDTTQLDDFQRWYDDVHAADLVKSQQYWSRQRYQRKGQGNLDSEFYAFYESRLPEPAAALNYLKWPQRDPTLHKALDLRHVWTYNKILPPLPG